jgi:tetratricopeptide (TPR) repeat protein
MRTAVQLDPLSAVYNDSLAHRLASAGRLAEAREQLEHTIRMDPQFRPAIESLGWVHVLEGDYEGAIAAFDQLPKAAGHEYAGAGDRGYAYAKVGRVTDAQRMLDLLQARAHDNPELILDVDFALIHEGLGDRDQALAYLSSAIERRMGTVVLLGSFAAFAEAHSDPRFRALLDRIGIPQAVPA